MAVVTGLTAARMLEIENASIVGAQRVGDDLVLTNFGGVETNVGSIVGPGVEGIETRYNFSTSGTVVPTTGVWTLTPPTVPKGQYLWIALTMQRPNGSDNVYFSIYQAMDGIDGDKGDKGDPGDWYGNDTGWVSITPTPPVAAYTQPPMVRRINNLVFLKGGFTNITVDTNPTLAQLPASQFYPPGYIFVSGGSADNEKAMNMAITSSGTIQIRTKQTAAFVMLTGIVYTTD